LFERRQKTALERAGDARDVLGREDLGERVGDARDPVAVEADDDDLLKACLDALGGAGSLVSGRVVTQIWQATRRMAASMSLRGVP
jgi:hypothetical protein